MMVLPAGTLGPNGVRVRLEPTANTTSAYNIQRALLGATTAATTINCNLNTTAPASDSAGTPAGTSFSTVGAVTVSAGATGSFTNFDLANGGYCYRVMVQNPNTGQASFSNYVPVNIPGTSDSTPPTTTSASLTGSGGFANTLDQGDKIAFDFQDTACGTNCGISIAGNAVIRVTDSDCGTATQAGPAACTGGNTNTVADIICGSAGNATCTLQTGPNGANTELIVTMTVNPSVISAGSTAGAQYPVVVTDSQGITDLSGNSWNLAGSADRVFGPFGN